MSQMDASFIVNINVLILCCFIENGCFIGLFIFKLAVGAGGECYADGCYINDVFHS